MQGGNKIASLPNEREVKECDFALFLSVMKVKKAYRDVLSIILDEHNLKLKEVKTEQVVLNRSGKRAIRLDAWALDWKNRQFDVEMQDDIFGKDMAKYTFTEKCEEVPELALEDGTKKIFLNMASRNGRPELVSLLQYMKNTNLDNPDILVKDERILELDKIVGEVRQSEEWEAVKMNILEIGMEKGMEKGMDLGRAETLVKDVNAIMKNLGLDLAGACKGMGITIDEFHKAEKTAGK